MFRLFLLCLFCLASDADEALVVRQKVLMGTFVTLSVDRKHKELIEPSFTLLQNIEKSLSSFDKNSPISKLNQNKSAKLDAFSYEALQLSRDFYRETDGYFNIAIGKITKDIYRFGEDERVAGKEELQEASVDINGLRFSRYGATLKRGVKIDLGGMGKGYGVDKTVAFLQAHSVQKAIVALSGDIRCIGRCKIAINNPLNAQTPLALFSIEDSGVTTSGNYNRYIQTKEYNHLINPKTKHSEVNFISVTLISKQLSSARLDAYATAVSVMPPKKACHFLDSKKLGYIILQADKKLLLSSNIADYAQELKLK